VDLEDGTLAVRRTLSITKNDPVFTPPKTSGSRRSVKLTRAAIEALRSHLQRQLEEIRIGGVPSGGRAASYSLLRPASRSIDEISPHAGSSRS
jgi:hypothetical protein